MSAEFCEELSLLIRTGWRVIAVETFEELRGVQLIEHVAKKHETRVHTWSRKSRSCDTTNNMPS